VLDRIEEKNDRSLRIVSESHHLRRETDAVSETVFLFKFLEFWMVEKVQNPTSSECC
jgi:hypothetical protein